jgi:hypothetical protein
MNRAHLATAALLLVGCEREFSIGEIADANGVANPPSLATPVKTDLITQVSPPKVDVLWAIDNSGSMSDKQRKLANNFSSFASFFVDSGVDWHMSTGTWASSRRTWTTRPTAVASASGPACATSTTRPRTWRPCSATWRGWATTDPATSAAARRS